MLVREKQSNGIHVSEREAIRSYSNINERDRWSNPTLILVRVREMQRRGVILVIIRTNQKRKGHFMS